MADEDLELGDVGDDEIEGAPKSKKMMIIIIIGVVLLLIIGVFGGLFATGFFDDETEVIEQVDGENGDKATKKDADAEDVKQELIYWPLEPAFVLNFEGKSKARYMQIGLEVVMTNNKVSAGVKKHSPVIRNEIVLLLSGQKYEEMVTPDGKEQLRAELIEVINGILKERKIKKGITNIYFTSFVMQ